MSVLEATSLGVPVIASTAGGLADLMRGRRLGVVEHVDEATVAAVIRRAIEQYPAFLVETATARDAVTARYSPGAVAARLATLRDAVATDSGRGRAARDGRGSN